MNADPRQHRLALDNDPEIAREIGLLLSCFAIIELSPPHMLAKLTGMTHADADVALGHFRNFSSRLDLILAIASSRPAGDKAAAEIRDLVPRVRDCSVIRNKYAHSLYQQEGDGRRTWWRMISWLTDATRQTRSSFITLESIRHDCGTLRATLYDLTNYSQIVVPPQQPAAPPP